MKISFFAAAVAIGCVHAPYHKPVPASLIIEETENIKALEIILAS